MKSILQSTLIILLLMAVVQPVSSQNKRKSTNLSGYVKDSNGNIVNDVSFYVDDVLVSHSMNKYGYYKVKIAANADSIKLFSYGRGVLKIANSGQKKHDFIYENILPGTTKKRANGRSDFVYKDIYEMIRAKVPGVTVQPDNTILVRGITSINASIEPLLVVDGAPVGSIDNIAPEFVKSITVLKGPESAVYGVRGANGVILITLKSN